MSRHLRRPTRVASIQLARAGATNASRDTAAGRGVAAVGGCPTERRDLPA
jgi:hypothetical protein